MKKIILSIFASVLLLASCEDAIDIQQPGRLDTSASFETLVDLQDGLFGVYAEYDYTPAIQFNAAFTDEITIGFDNGGQDILFILNPQSAISSAQWVNFYDALNAATRVILAADEIEFDPADQDAFDDILGQAYALRAWAHFELLTYFSPDLTDDNAPGVIILDFIPSIDQELGRNTTGEVFAIIESDLDQAANLLVTDANPTFVSQDFVTALRARIAAYRGDYGTAASLAEQLSSKYPLADSAQYVDMFLDQDNTEIIFKLERTINGPYDGQGSTGSATAGGWAGANFAFVSADIDGSPYFEASVVLRDALEPGDIRSNVLFHPTSAGDTLMVGKYPGSEGQPLMNDLKIFRASEMLLIRAEAAADANDLPGAAVLIDELRDARFGSDQPTPTFANQQEAFRAILDERQLEFAFEGFRWVDLKRLGERAGLTTLERDPVECAVNSACSIELSDIRMNAIPIPILELNANGTIQQTQGY